MKYNEVSKSKLREGQLLWRYIDLHKFIDLVSNLRLSFTRLDHFNDPFEGVSYKLIAEKYHVRKSEVKNPELLKLKPDINELRENKLSRILEESDLKRKSQYVNCWVKSERESLAMWNLYSNRDSIALKVDARKLINYFKNVVTKGDYLPECEFICGSVDYLKLNPFDPFDKPRLPKYSSYKKDLAFDYEKEFRLLVAIPLHMIDTASTRIEIPIEKRFFDLITIVSHPEMEEWKFKNIDSLCFKYQIPNLVKSDIELI